MTRRLSSADFADAAENVKRRLEGCSADASQCPGDTSILLVGDFPSASSAYEANNTKPPLIGHKQRLEKMLITSTLCASHVVG